MYHFRLVRNWFGSGGGYFPALAILCLCLGHVAPLHASTIFSNITGNCCGGEPVDGTAFDGIELAEAFTSPGSYAIADVQVVVSQVFGVGGGPNFNVYFYSNNGGAPGALLATLGTNLVAPANGGIVTIPVSSQLTTVSGAEYWIVLTAFNADTEISWEAGGTQSVPTALTVPQLDGSWVPNNTANLQFEVDGSSTPEPSSVVLAVIPVSWMAFRTLRARLRRRNLAW